jgi:lysophospholipase
MATLDVGERDEGASGAAPLYAVPGHAWPAGQAEWLVGAGGLRLRAALFPAANPRGSVVLSGGRTEFIEKYVEVVGELVARGYTVLTHDWRGQGLSDRLLPDRLKGHAAGFADFVADYGRLLDRFEARLPAPRIAVSHSMGGCLTTLVLARGEPRLHAAVFSAPMLGLLAEKPWLNRGLTAIANTCGLARAYAVGGPVDPFTAVFETERLTHDRARYDRARAIILAERDLALGSVTWGWVRSAFAALAELRLGAAVTRIPQPVSILGAAEDTLIDLERQRLVAGRIPGARYAVVPGARHEILMETDAIRDVFWAEFDAVAARAARDSR